MANLSLSRRSFLKASAMAAAATTVGFAATPSTALAEGEDASAGEIKRIRSCCRACGKVECGVWVTVQDNKVIKVEGDESNAHSRGHCCAKSQSSMLALYHPDRLRYCMKRTNPKGEDDPGWVRITLAEAFDEAGAKFNEIVEKYGGEANFAMGGTSRVWAQPPYGTLKSIFPTPNAHLAYEICKGPRHFGGILTDEIGSPWMEVEQGPLVYVQWGTASEYSNYDSTNRTVVDCSQRAYKHILVDPRMTPLGKEADVWLPLDERPVLVEPREGRPHGEGLVHGNERRHRHGEPHPDRGRLRPRVDRPVLGLRGPLPALHLLGREQQQAYVLGCRGLPVGGREAQDPDDGHLDRASVQAHHRGRLAARPLQVRQSGRRAVRRLLGRGQRGRQALEPGRAAQEPGAVPRRRGGEAEGRLHHQRRHGVGGVLRQPGAVHAGVRVRGHRGAGRQDRGGRAHLHDAPEPAARQRRHPLPACSRPDGPRGAEHPRAAADRLHHRQLRRARRQPRFVEGPGGRLLRPRQHAGDRP